MKAVQWQRDGTTSVATDAMENDERKAKKKLLAAVSGKRTDVL